MVGSTPPSVYMAGMTVWWLALPIALPIVVWVALRVTTAILSARQATRRTRLRELFVREYERMSLELAQSRLSERERVAADLFGPNGLREFRTIVAEVQANGGEVTEDVVRRMDAVLTPKREADAYDVLSEDPFP